MGRGSEKPAEHTQQTLTQLPPPRIYATFKLLAQFSFASVGKNDLMKVS